MKRFLKKNERSVFGANRLLAWLCNAREVINQVQPISRLALLCLIAAFAVACSPRTPEPSDFTAPPIGTLIPGGHEESIHPELSSDQSGALVINQTGLRIQVAVSNTITTVAAGEDFLFMLPPGTF